ncbi:MAG: hypothetical protein WBD24_07290 [Candidatus Omnitrophota bacterium]
MKKRACLIMIIALIFAASSFSYASEEIKYDFEGSNKGWSIPDWAYYQGDHVAKEVEVSSKKASTGESSLAVMCEFPGNVWKAALVEHLEDMDLSGKETISADIYLPKDAPKGIIVARFILTIGIGWHFTEMRYAVPLVPGRWTRIEAKLENDEVEKSDWKGRKEKRLFHHIHHVKKIAIRIEYDASPPYRVGHKYHGPVYIDNVVIK